MWSKADEFKVGSTAHFTRKGTSNINCQEQKVQSRNNCLSLWVASTDEKKTDNKKCHNTINLIKTAHPNHIALQVGKQGVHSADVGAINKFDTLQEISKRHMMNMKTC